MLGQQLRTAFVLFGVAFLVSGTNACQKDYCVACNADIGTTTPTETPTGTDDGLTTGTLTPTPTFTNTGGAAGSTSPTPTGSITPTPTDTGSVVVPSDALRSLWLDVAKSSTTAAPGVKNAQGLKNNWLGHIGTSAKDSDGDGFTDDLEKKLGTDPNDAKSFPSKFKTNASPNLTNDYNPSRDGLLAASQMNLSPEQRELLKDSDGDGCPDIAEILSGSDPYDPKSKPSPDSDGDCLSDDYELAVGLNPYDPDTDHDGVADDIEVILGMNPWNADTDGDGILDWKELVMGTGSEENGFLIALITY